MSAFTFPYTLEVIEVSDKAPTFEVDLTVNADWEPADPTVGFQYPVVCIESVELPGASDEVNRKWFDDCDRAFIDSLEEAAWAWLKKQNEEAIDEDDRY